MSIQQLIYASRPFGFDTSVLASILSKSRLRNEQNDITGALICRPDIYVQLLEGPTGKVENLFEHIMEDDRHTEVQVLVRAQVEDRLFGDWAMKHDPAVTWLWTPEELRKGAMEVASERDIRSVFVRSATSE